MSNNNSRPGIRPGWVLASAIVLGYFVAIVAEQFPLCPSSLGLSAGCDLSAADFLAQLNGFVIFFHTYWQLFTSIFVTYSVADVVFNAIAVIILDLFVDNSFNHTRYFAIFFFSALLGNVLTLLMGPDYASAGASGGIFGLFAATFAFNWAEQKKIDSSTLILFIAIFVSSSFVPGEPVNWIAHVGGAIGGFIAGPLLYLSLKEKLSRYESVSQSALVTRLLAVIAVAFMIFGSAAQFLLLAVL